MVSLDDWSELITVDYNGGLGGEFFGLLLHDAIYKDTFYKTTSKNKFDFKPYDVFNAFEKKEPLQNALKKLYYYKKKFYDYNFPHGNLEDTLFNDLYNSIFKYKLNFSDEYRNYVYENYSHRFDGTFKISLYHDTNVNILNKKYDITLPDIFPKSKNIMLVCPDYHIFFIKFLLIVKVISHHAFFKSNAELKAFIDVKYKQFNNFEFYIFDDYPCLKIDMYSFLYEEKNYDKELSNLLGQDIVLDKQKVKEYAQKNIEIFNQYGLDINGVYSNQYFIEKLDNFLRKF
jgi:hypothetical protein